MKQTWTLNKNRTKLINAFEKKCYEYHGVNPERKQKLRYFRNKAKIKLFRKYKNTPNTGDISTRREKMKGQRNRGRRNRSWEMDVEDWMGASVWRVGRTAEDRLMYGKIRQGSTVRKRISERDEIVYLATFNSKFLHFNI